MITSAVRIGLASFLSALIWLPNGAQAVSVVDLGTAAGLPAVMIDAAGQAHWVGQLQRGLSRGALMLQFSESAEYQVFHQGSTEVVMTYVGLLRRAPEQTGFDHWLAQLQGGASIVELIEGFLRSPEYNQRF